jgi:hypothetical protein
MKFTKLFPFAVAFVLPLAVVSCGDQEEEKKPEASNEEPSGAKDKTHADIAEEISVTMNEMMDGVIAIKDTASANAFAEKADGYVASLKDLLATAKALPAPTDEEKDAVQKTKDASDAKGMEMMMAMGKLQENPDAEAIGKVLEKIFSNEEMDATMEGFETLYDLKDNSGPGEPADPNEPEDSSEPEADE